MTAVRMSAHLLLARRIARGGRLRPSLLGPFVLATIFTALFAVTCGFGLSGEQAANRDLGRFEHRASTPVGSGAPAGGAAAQLDDAMRTAGADHTLALISPEVLFDDLPPVFVTGPRALPTYFELADPAGSFPQRFELVSGRWATQVNEIVISRDLRSQLGGGELSAFSGTVRLRVVGVFEDDFNLRGQSVVAGSGTWAAFPASVEEVFEPAAHLHVLWSGGPEPQQVVDVLRETIPDQSSEFVPVLDRQNVASGREHSLSEQVRLLFTYPLLALSVLVAVSAFRANRRWMLTYSERALHIGLNRGEIGLTLSAVFALFIACAWVAGAGVGALVGNVLRATALPAVLTQPMGPLRGPGPLLLSGLLLVAVATSVALCTLIPGRRASAGLMRLHGAVPWTLIRRTVAVVAAVHGVSQATRPDLALDDMGSTVVLVVVAAVLLAPDITLLGARCLSSARPRTMLAKRLVDADRFAVGLTSLVIATALAVPTTLSCFVATDTRTRAAGNLSTVPAGQVWIDAGNTDRPAAYVKAITAALGGRAPVEIRWTQAFTEPGENTGLLATNIASVPDGAALLEVFGRSEGMQDMADLVDGGGVALWGGRIRPVYGQIGSEEPVELGVDVQAMAKPELEYQAPFAGVMSEATARNLGFDSSPLQIVYPGVSESEIVAAVSGVTQAGLSAKVAQYHVAPPRTVPEPEWYFALGGLLAVAGFLLIALMRSTGELLHERATQLLAIGFTIRNTTGVALIQLGLAVFAGVVAAVAGSVAAISVLAGAPEQHLVLDVPVDFIVSAVVAVVVLSVAGILATMRTVGRKQSDVG